MAYSIAEVKQGRRKQNLVGELVTSSPPLREGLPSTTLKNVVLASDAPDGFFNLNSIPLAIELFYIEISFDI